MDSQKTGGFFTFIMETQTNKTLLNDFNKLKTLPAFKKFFIEKHPLYGLSEEELERIFAYRDKLCEDEELTRKQIGDIVCGRGY